MKKISTTMFLNIIFLNVLFCQNIQQIASRTLNGTVSIYLLDKSNQMKSMASGAIISENLIVTNFHVIDGAYSGYIKINNTGNKLSIIGYTAIDIVNDLALLKVENTPYTGLKLNTNPVQIGDNIYVAGNPQGLTGTFSDGIVSAKRKIDNKNIIQITAPISPGSSGGPVINTSGEIIGIAVGANTNGQNLNFAIPSIYIDKLLNNQSGIKSISTLYRTPKLSSSQSTISVQGIEIRQIIWGLDDYSFNSEYEQIHEFSIKNNTEYKIGQIHLMLLVYDQTNTMVNYIEAFYPKNINFGSLDIYPNMAKTINAKMGGIYLRKRKINKWELRILDYQVIK